MTQEKDVIKIPMTKSEFKKITVGDLRRHLKGIKFPDNDPDLNNILKRVFPENIFTKFLERVENLFAWLTPLKTKTGTHISERDEVYKISILDRILQKEPVIKIVRGVVLRLAEAFDRRGFPSLLAYLQTDRVQELHQGRTMPPSTTTKETLNIDLAQNFKVDTKDKVIKPPVAENKIDELKIPVSNGNTGTMLENILNRFSRLVSPIKAHMGRFISGYGGGDKVHALLEKGEYVLRKEAVRNIGLHTVDAINRMTIPSLLANLQVDRMYKLQAGGVQKLQRGGMAQTSAQVPLDTMKVDFMVDKKKYPATMRKSDAGNLLKDLKEMHIIYYIRALSTALLTFCINDCY